jgi:anhydro-N-acetylmuramic acid kinase
MTIVIIYKFFLNIISMKNKIFTALGLMSGTSMDGVDLSVIKTDGYNQLSFLLDKYYPYDTHLHKKLIDLRNLVLNEKDLLIYSGEIDELERKITLFHAEKINEILSASKNELDLVGFHGQTIFHNPLKKITKQLGDGNLLSQLVNKPVVYDFRQADMQNNGQGAPLSPIFHGVLTSKITEKYDLEFPVSFLNIGGISNVTKVDNFNNLEGSNLYACDIAPGNCLIDEWIRKNSTMDYDKNGNIAKSGKVDQLILNQVIDNFKMESYSKSLDIKDFDVSFARGLSFEDGCATITEFTAFLISEGIKFLNKENIPNKYLLCGGGRKNNYLIERISRNLKNYQNIHIEKIDNYNLNGDFIESQAFGYLAIRKFLNLPISYPSTTGCDNPVVGGKLVNNF